MEGTISVTSSMQLRIWEPSGIHFRFKLDLFSKFHGIHSILRVVLDGANWWCMQVNNVSTANGSRKLTKLVIIHLLSAIHFYSENY